jgi:predicted dehydrogenase
MAWLDNDFLGPLHIQTTEGTEVRPCPPPAWVRDLALGDDDIGLAISAYVEADRAFLDAMAQRRDPVPSFAEAVVAHRLVDAAYRSAGAGGVPIAFG